MRPLLQGHSYFKKHLYLRNGRYYFRLDVPTDLAHYFPTLEVKRSLKTSDPDAANLAALALELKVQQAYALLRVGMLSDDMVGKLIDVVMPAQCCPVWFLLNVKTIPHPPCEHLLPQGEGFKSFPRPVGEGGRRLGEVIRQGFRNNAKTKPDNADVCHVIIIIQMLAMTCFDAAFGLNTFAVVFKLILWWFYEMLSLKWFLFLSRIAWCQEP